ncbi:MAG: LemA family protein [Methylobacteriaceae bacterium]|jgi:LemA protein|nr:LemA family protein [Methylobacteriaceae bacterium]
MSNLSSTGYFLIALGVVVLMGLWIVIKAYNSLVAMDQRAKQALSDIDVQMKQRHDVIPNLVEVVKGYATHEREALEAVVNARSGALAPKQSVAEQARSENILTEALGKLFALSEAYPDLKANVNFRQLQDELATIENKIAASRRFYNNAVSEFNTFMDLFPVNLFSRSLFGFKTKEFFDLEGQRAEVSAPPSISFSRDKT